MITWPKISLKLKQDLWSRHLHLGARLWWSLLQVNWPSKIDLGNPIFCLLWFMLFILKTIFIYSTQNVFINVSIIILYCDLLFVFHMSKFPFHYTYCHIFNDIYLSLDSSFFFCPILFLSFSRLLPHHYIVRFHKPLMQRSERTLENPCGNESQAAKRQKLEGGNLRKVQEFVISWTHSSILFL